MSVPTVKRRKPLARGKEPREPSSIVSFGVKALSGALRQLRPTDDLASTHPQAVVANADARWWRLSNLDSAVVSNAEGSGVWFYRRDAHRFRVDAARSAKLHAEIRSEWDRLAQEYRKALPEVTSPESWERAFGI